MTGWKPALLPAQKKSPAPIARGRAYTWRRPTLTRPIVSLPSALRRFTSGFGMGPGGSTTLWSPEGNRGAAGHAVLRLLNCGSGGLGDSNFKSEISNLKSQITNVKISDCGLAPASPLADIHTENFFFPTCSLAAIHGLGKQDEFKNRNQANRMISTGKLNILLHLHFQPINVVVFDDP